MAIFNFFGYETGNLIENASSSGTVAASTVVKRTGAYALRTNPTLTAVGWARHTTLAATGLIADMAVANFFATFYFRYAVKPAANSEEILSLIGTAGEQKGRLRINSTGTIALYNNTPTLQATGSAVLAQDTWYRFDINWNDTANTQEIKIYNDPAPGVTPTLLDTIAGTITTAESVAGLYLGKVQDRNGNTVDFYFDDVCFSDSAYPGAGECKIAVPIGAGAASSWTNGAFTDTFADVDEIPHNTDTDYLEASGAGDNTDHTLDMQASATIGINGAIGAVKTIVIAREAADTGVNSVAHRRLFNGSGFELTALELTTTYALLAVVDVTDPSAGGGVITTADFDSIEVGMAANAIVDAQRFTAAYVTVWSDGAVAVAVLDVDDADSQMAAVQQATDLFVQTLSDHVAIEAAAQDWAPPSGRAPVLERPDEDETADQLPALHNAWPLMLISDGFAAAIAEAARSEEWAPPSGAAPVLERPDEDEDGAQLLPPIDTSYFAHLAATSTEDWLPQSGAAPVLERPDDDEDGAQLLPPLDTSYDVAALTITDDEDWPPASGIGPLIRPDEDNDWADTLPPLDTSFQVAQLAADEEAIPVDGTIAAVAATPAEDDDGAALLPALDTSFDSALIAIAGDEVIPLSGAAPVLERPDEDEDGAQLLPPLPTGDDIAIATAAESEGWPPVSGAAPVLERPDEDEDGAQLLPPLPAGDDVAVAAAAGDEAWAPVSGAAPVLERPDEDEDGAQLLPPFPGGDDVALAMAAESEGWPPVSGISPLDRPDEDEDGAQLLPGFDTSYDVAIAMAAGDEVLPVSGVAPVIEYPPGEDEDDGAQLLPGLDTSFVAAVLAAADSEVLPVTFLVGALTARIYTSPAIEASFLAEAAITAQSSALPAVGGESASEPAIGGSTSTQPAIEADIETEP